MAKSKTGGLGTTSFGPHQSQQQSLIAVTASTKARGFQQLVYAIGQATVEGQVPLHNAGFILSHQELTLYVEGV